MIIEAMFRWNGPQTTDATRRRVSLGHQHWFRETTGGVFCGYCGEALHQLAMLA